jgi:hypothetical protein
MFTILSILIGCGGEEVKPTPAPAAELKAEVVTETAPAAPATTTTETVAPTTTPTTPATPAVAEGK